ncbi:hypothetical protein [Xenorhabdus doucetiae]|nr:hypothetical protein [Xenorhabdus sp. 3]
MFKKNSLKNNAGRWQAKRFFVLPAIVSRQAASRRVSLPQITVIKTHHQWSITSR